MTLIALDPASTVTGAAQFRRDGTLEWAQDWKLRQSRSEHPGSRWQRLREMLRSLPEPVAVAVEDVKMHASTSYECKVCGARAKGGGRCGKCGGPVKRKRHMNVLAAHAYGGARSMIEEWCFEIGVDLTPIHTAAVKKAAVGKGGGKGTAKADILRAARARFPDAEIPGHDAADAIFVGVAAMQDLGWVEAPVDLSQAQFF